MVCGIAIPPGWSASHLSQEEEKRVEGERKEGRRGRRRGWRGRGGTGEIEEEMGGEKRRGMGERNGERGR